MVKNISSKISNSYVITLPLTPASFTTENPEIISKKAAILTLSCGGGMGGSCWKEYVIGVDESMFNIEGLVTFTLYNGKKKKLNTRNIVSVTPTTIIRACVKHSNNNYSDNYREMFFTTEDATKTKLINSYDIKYNPNIIELKPFDEIMCII